MPTLPGFLFKAGARKTLGYSSKLDRPGFPSQELYNGGQPSSDRIRRHEIKSWHLDAATSTVHPQIYRTSRPKEPNKI